jgi:hypothetical protein
MYDPQDPALLEFLRENCRNSILVRLRHSKDWASISRTEEFSSLQRALLQIYTGFEKLAESVCGPVAPMMDWSDEVGSSC